MHGGGWREEGETGRQRSRTEILWRAQEFHLQKQAQNALSALSKEAVSAGKRLEGVAAGRRWGAAHRNT